MHRCGWATKDLNIIYHDTEWGVPVYDDNILFEFIILEMAQAGLNWYTVLKKRENYRAAYDNFDPLIVADYSESKKHALLNDVGIIRNKLKIEASILNARVFLEIQNKHKSFSTYIWQFTDNKIIHNHFTSLSEIPAATELSSKISKDLKTKEFKFFGPTTCYAFLQAVGIVNDHITTCFRYKPGMSS